MSAPSAFKFADTAPRYTSYPTAPHFHDGVGEETVRGWMASVKDGEAVSLYIHIPFCDRLCWFCACHTRHTLRYEPVAAYLDMLYREIALVAAALPDTVQVGAVHLGGGSPTLLTPADLGRLLDTLRATFRFTANVSVSVEIDPTDMDEARLDAIAAVGTTRASLGVQDFRMEVQKAINREQSFEDTQAVVEGLRKRGVSAINLDLVYGLPHQSVESIAETVGLSLSLKPDRVALFGYAHVPWFKKHQKLIDEAVLPGREARMAQSARAAALIRDAGYEAIGLDHFALPGDSLALAARRGALRRNFQGYTDDGCETLIGLGPSSVSGMREGYAQNTTAMGGYRRAVQAGTLPVIRGFELSAEDRVRAWVIERLMCDFGFSADEASARFGAAAGAVVDEAQDMCARFPDVLVRQGGSFMVQPEARAHVRSVAAEFDSYLGRGAARHSLAV